MFFTPNIWCNLRLLQLKLQGKQYKLNTSPKSYKTEIKILANPGLASSGFEQPSPDVKCVVTGKTNNDARLILR